MQIPNIPNPTSSASGACDKCNPAGAPSWTNYVNPCWLACEGVLELFGGTVTAINDTVIPILNDTVQVGAAAVDAIRSEANTIINGTKSVAQDFVWLGDHMVDLLELLNPKGAWKYFVKVLTESYQVGLDIVNIVITVVLAIAMISSLGGLVFWFRLIF